MTTSNYFQELDLKTERERETFPEQYHGTVALSQCHTNIISDTIINLFIITMEVISARPACGTANWSNLSYCVTGFTEFIHVRGS